MTGLRELQQRCRDAFLFGDANAVARFVVDDHIPALARVQVYQNNVREGFSGVLLAGYPVIAQLVGEDCFRTLAVDYSRRYPSVSGDLAAYGASFPGLLDALYAGTEFDYLADVARVEWHCETVRCAQDAAAVDLPALQQRAGARFGEQRFGLHPAARLLASPYPVFGIWQAHQSDTVGAVDLAAGGERVLVRRCATGVEVVRLAEPAFLLLESLARGTTLRTAMGDVVARWDDRVAGGTLQRVADLAVLIAAGDDGGQLRDAAGRVTPTDG